MFWVLIQTISLQQYLFSFSSSFSVENVLKPKRQIPLWSLLEVKDLNKKISILQYSLQHVYLKLNLLSCSLQFREHNFLFDTTQPEALMFFLSENYCSHSAYYKIFPLSAPVWIKSTNHLKLLYNCRITDTKQRLVNTSCNLNLDI